MNAAEIAVLSYHAWEIDCARLVDDVQSLRERGWRDISLDELEALLSGRPMNGSRFFHITSDDGAERDREFVRALRSLSCPGTLFVSLGVMSEKARAVCREMLSQVDVCVEDHSLLHKRAFHYRHVIGFHSEAAPLLSAPDELGLALGSPVCMCGNDLALPRFTPEPAALVVCREKAATLAETPGGAAWTQALGWRLVQSGFGFRRLGRLCVQGEYETRAAFRKRTRETLEEGRRRFIEFVGRPPAAFAHPWWQGGDFAEKCLRDLGYRMTFAGLGLCRDNDRFKIPRLFVNNSTPRPLDLEKLAAIQDGTSLTGWVRALCRRIIYA